MIMQSLWILPLAEAAGPKRIGGVISGTEDPGAVTDQQWQVNQDIPDFIFYYKISGGSGQNDVVNVTIQESGLDPWEDLMGEGWEFCDCSLDAGSYVVTVQANANANAPVSFEIGLYFVPEPPVDFSGHIPAGINSKWNFSDFELYFSEEGDHKVILDVTSGAYEFLIDDVSKAQVTQRTELTISFPKDSFPLFQIYASTGEDVEWSVQIQGSPKLEVRILNSCPPLNSSNPECVAGAEATASDGSSPNMTFDWTDNGAGGSFNSTTGRWVVWTPPPMVGVFTLTVKASAPGYISDTDDLSVETTEAIPEFMAAALPLVLALALVMVLCARRSRRSV